MNMAQEVEKRCIEYSKAMEAGKVPQGSMPNFVAQLRSEVYGEPSLGLIVKANCLTDRCRREYSLKRQVKP